MGLSEKALRLRDAKRNIGAELLTAVRDVLLVTTGTLKALAQTVVLLLLIVLLSTNLSVLVLRRDTVDRPHFRTPTVLPVLAIGSCFLLLAQQSAGPWLRAALMLAVGTILYLASGARRRVVAQGAE